MRLSRKVDQPIGHKAAFACLVIGVLLCFSGCSDSSSVGVVAVSGKLMVDGSPVGGVRLTFTPQEGRPSIATTNDQGEFEPWFRGDQNGVQKGTHRITVEKAETGDLLDVGAKPSKELQALLDRFGHGGTEQYEVQINEATDDLVIDLSVE